MSKNIIIGLFTLALVAIGGYLYLYSPKKTEEIVAQPEVMMEKVESTNSRYLPYSNSAYTSALGQRRVLYFYATWCPSCKVANEEFTKSPDQIPPDTIVLRVNYNDQGTDKDEKALAAKYGITYQHTFVQVDGEGRELIKWNGGGLAQLLAKLQ